MAPKTKSKKTNKDKYVDLSTINTITSNDEDLGNSSSDIIPSLEKIPQDLLKSLRSGYGNSRKPRPLFNNSINNFHDFHNQLKHYLLVNGLYQHINTKDITASDNLALYLAVAGCLQGRSLQLVQNAAFANGQKAYRLICQKFLGNKDCREARSMMLLASATQHENESLGDYISRLEGIKNQLEEFDTIKNNNYYVIKALHGLHMQYETLKTVININKLPTWEDLKEIVESHGSMLGLDIKKKSWKCLVNLALPAFQLFTRIVATPITRDLQTHNQTVVDA